MTVQFCATCQQPLPQPRVLCAGCGHSITSHHITKTGALTWVECAVEAAHEAGDHYVVTGRVTELGPCQQDRPLLFYRGRYAATDPGAAAGPPEVVDTLLAWPRHADWM